MGRTATTNAEKVKKGTNQKVREREESGPTGNALNKMPAPYPYICEEGRKIWRNYGQKLIEKELLKDTELMAFGRYCHYMGLFERLMSELNNEDLIVTLHNLVEAPNPKWKLANDCQDRADRIARQFGMSPSSRKSVPAKAEEKKAHPLADLLNSSDD